jgi:hypothetical protein
MYNDNDVVKAKIDLSKSVLKGCIGTIVLIYQKPSLAYEVEFVNNRGETLELLTVQPTDIEPIK